MLKRLFLRIGRIKNRETGLTDPVPVAASFNDGDLEEIQEDSSADDTSFAVDYVRQLFLNLDIDRTKHSPAERQWLRQHKNELSSENASWIHMVPRLPSVVPQLMAATRDAEKGSGQELAELISSDPVLAASLLKVVNSAALRCRKESIESLKQAVVIVGMTGIREAIAAAFMSPIANFKADSRLDAIAIQELWTDSLGVAVRLRNSAEHSGLAQGFELFLAGITHSVGLMLLLRRLDLMDEPSISAGFADALEALSRHYSVAVAAGWQLPSGTIALLSAWAEDKETALTHLLTRSIGSVRRASLEQRA